MSEAPLTWCDVLEQEYAARHGGASPFVDAPPSAGTERLEEVHRRIHQEGPSALCLSGGGIRSAAFGLGVLQGLAREGVLDRFDYLSTVSGGGYIGGWYTAWLKRQLPTRVYETLNPDKQANFGDTPVDRVRRTCRYLAPRGGALSADVWTLLTTLARNLLLNWLVLLPLIAAALLLPRVYFAFIHLIEQNDIDKTYRLVRGGLPLWFLAVSLAGFAAANAYVIATFAGFGAAWAQGRFLLLCLLPAIVGAASGTLFWAAYPQPLELPETLAVCSLIPAVAWIVIGAVATRRDPTGAPGSSLQIRVGVRTVLASIAAGAVQGLGNYWFAMHQFGFGEELTERYAVVAVPIVLLLTLLTIVLFVGFASREFDDAALEWWSRCGAWFGIAAAVWLAAGALVFYMADAIQFVVSRTGELLGSPQVASVLVALLSPLVSSIVGLMARSSGDAQRPSPVRAALHRIALPATIVLLLSSLAWINLRTLERLEYHRTAEGTLCSGATSARDDCHPAGAGLEEVLMLGGALLAFGLVMSGFVPANRFSLHGMYRQRLVRTFLGASRPERAPNPFTGFDAHDDLRVHELQHVRPLHVINATLNAVSSTSTGPHERSAQSFTFSPLHVGSRSVHYRPAASYGSERSADADATGLSLGMALAVSGAAASPAMGIYSTPARAFLLTLANARLGLWFGNPDSGSTWKRSDPPFGVGPLAREMLGLSTERNPYVYLSDGGHYENLGLWEMVARRCRFIVVADAGCDPEYRFDDLANAVRRIKLDLGVPIDLKTLGMTREGQGKTNPHVAIGTIHYGVVDEGAPDGTLVYLKATLSGDEPVDVLNFSRLDPSFPHDSTGNQFFDERRFESYRALGLHTVEAARGHVRSLSERAPRPPIPSAPVMPGAAAAGEVMAT